MAHMEDLVHSSGNEVGWRLDREMGAVLEPEQAMF